jgi:hypothetical protein
VAAVAFAFMFGCWVLKRALCDNVGGQEGTNRNVSGQPHFKVKNTYLGAGGRSVRLWIYSDTTIAGRL